MGILSSVLEAEIPEQMFVTPQTPGEALSAVTAIELASAAGQKIYHITQANESTVLPLIHHSSEVMREISDALSSGKDVITHTDDVSVSGWTGAGYIIFDPQTGDGAYKIGGGQNGVFITIVAIFGLLLALAAIIPALVTGSWLVLLAWLPTILTGLALFVGPLVSICKSWNSQQWKGFFKYFRPYWVADQLITYLLIALGILSGGSFALLSILLFMFINVTGDTPRPQE